MQLYSYFMAFSVQYVSHKENFCQFKSDVSFKITIKLPLEKEKGNKSFLLDLLKPPLTNCIIISHLHIVIQNCNGGIW